MRKISLIALYTAVHLFVDSAQANPLEAALSGNLNGSFRSSHSSNQRGRSPMSQGDPSQGILNGEFSGAQTYSDRVTSCETIAQSSWNEIYSSANGEFASLDNIGSYYVPLAISKAFETNTGESGVGPEKAQQLKQLFNNILVQMITCQAYLSSMDVNNFGPDYSEFEGNGANAAKSDFGAAGLECANQPTQEAQATCMERAKEEGGMGCSHEGAETQDYLACKKIVKFMDGFVIGKQVMQVQQTFRAGAKQMELQDEITQKARTEEGIQITDGMNAQAESTRQQGNLAYEMAAFDGAKAGVLLSMISEFPTPEKMITRCQSTLNSNFVNAARVKLGNYITSYINNDQTIKVSEEFRVSAENKAVITEALNAFNADNTASIDTELACAQAITTNQNAGGGANNFFLNQEVRDKMKGVAMKAGLEALANGAKGALLHDQAGMIKDAMKDIEEFEPPEFPVAEELPATASECLVDPSAEGCIAPAAGGFDGFTGQNFNASFGGGANLGSGTEEGGLSDTDSSVTGATDRNLLPTNFGTVDGVNTTGNDFVDGQARAGSIKAGQVAAGGGGGGGSAGGGGGFGGGGGANKGPQKAKPSGKRDINIKTKGSGLATVGGRGAIGASKKKATNPFSKLLGKNKTKGNSSLNFRGPAQVAGKKGSLFQMISNRYNSVSAKDRLLKYENKN